MTANDLFAAAPELMKWISLASCLLSLPRHLRTARSLIVIAERQRLLGLAPRIKSFGWMSHGRLLARHEVGTNRRKRTMTANELFAAAPDLMKKWAATSLAVAVEP